ncbi:hypothetical protein V2A60_001417 [Cordyceps javanica]
MVHLLKRYQTGVATWMDMFDGNCTYQREILRRCTGSTLLVHSVCAFTAKHLSLLPAGEVWEHAANCYYSRALQALLEQIRRGASHLEDTLTATMLLASYEITADQDDAHKPHFDGATRLITTRGISASSTGMDLANFWIYIRHEIFVALVNEAPLQIEPRTWKVIWREKETDEHALGNHILWLVGRAIDVVYRLGTPSERRTDIQDEAAKWFDSLPASFHGTRYSGPDDQGFCKLYFAVPASALVPSFAAAADDADNPSGQSTFVSPDKDLGFAFTIGDEDVNDYFVTMRLRTTRSWGAIGLGSHDMAGALYFVMYLNDRGDNVTFSPRLAYGNYEPRFYDTMRWEYLPGTRVQDGFATLSFRCIECQNWPGADSGKGYLDLNSNSQKSIWALGPRQKLRSSDQRAALRYHESHGVFSIDMARTKGAADTPALTDKSVDEGITQLEHATKLFDVKSSIHAALMTLAILVLFPIGIVLLRVGRWATWHGANQGVALIVVLAGFGMGIATSFHYNRSMRFNSAHQIIGLLVVAFLLGQFALGVMHHLEFRQTRAPTKYGRIHVWLGNGVLLLAVFNMLGYFFAMNYAAALGLCITVMVLCLVALFLSIRQIRAAKKRRIAAAFGAAQAASYGEDRWSDNEPGTTRGNGDHDPLPNPNVNKLPSSPSPWKSGSGGRMSYEDEGHELGTRTNKPFS